MKYDAQTAQVKTLLPGAQNILILLPPEAGIDQLAAGLALYLSLEQIKKNVAIATEGIIRVGHTQLFGVGQIQNKIPPSSSGDLVLTLGGVVVPGPNGQEGALPLEKMDYQASGSDLKLIFRVKPGQKFEPTFITPQYEGGKFDLIFVIGAQNLQSLGNLYQNNQAVFSQTHLVNIDNQANSQFGTTNVVDPQSSSLSEIMGQVLPSLQLPIETDISSNILSGIFEATNNLQSPNVGAETYEIVAQSLKAGGQKPSEVSQPQPAPAPTSAPAGFDLSKLQTITPEPVKPEATSAPLGGAKEQQPEYQSSPEEMPSGEAATSGEPELDWLTPKIYKGGNVG